MSFTSDFLESEKKRKKKNSTGDSFTDAFLEEEEKRKEEAEKKLYVSSTTDPAPVRDYALRQKHLDMAPVKESERKWFQKGAFEDGYQFGDVTKTILGTDKDVKTNVTAGILGIGEKVIDTLAFLGNAMAQGQMTQAMNDNLMYNGLKQVATGEKTDVNATIANWQAVQAEAEKGITDFVAKDLYNEEEAAQFVTTFTDPMSIARHVIGVDEETDSVLGEKSDSLMQSAGQLAATIGLQAVGVPWWLTSATTAFGSEAESALNEGATYEEAFVSAGISAGAEVLTEKIAGISFGGKTVGDALADYISKGISSKFAKVALKLGIDAVGEGAEEWLTEDISNFGKWLTYQDEETLGELLFSEEAMDAKIEAFLGGVALGGGSNVTSAIGAKIKGVDPVTGLTEIEDLVVNKEVEERVAEAEKDGDKLTQREKSNIREAVIGELEKGYISTDLIEKTLGGEEYTSYQDTVNNEEALKKELEELRQTKYGDMNDIQRDRLTELKGMNLSDTTKRNELRAKLDEKMKKLVTNNSRLAESYNERARRSQAFEADLSQYNEKQAAVVKKAIESGILNNTNRTHEFVDMVSKISADKGVLFDFANNAKLKESGFAIDGATINGYVTKDGVTLNIDSAKALNSVVGHEITHVLEGTELYTEMQKALFEYAKSKNDYQGRYDKLTALYKNVEGANIDAELTADLVGDYLFTDADFINNLSTKHRNIFEKIYDEIKYLYKMATAGSKQARELEKVKRAFDKAYKESGKASEGTKYSMSDNTGKKLTNEQNEYFKDSKMRDENGNLKVMYHGSQDAGFHVFDPSHSDDGISLFFVDRNEVAASYSGTSETYEAQSIRTAEDMNNFIESIGAEGYEVVEKDGKFTLLYEGDRVADSNTAKGIYEEFCWYEGVGEGDANYKVYLNLTNPLEIDAEGRNWNGINFKTPDEKVRFEVRNVRAGRWIIKDNLYGENLEIDRAVAWTTEEYAQEALDDYLKNHPREQTVVKTVLNKTREIAKYAKENRYDGVIFKNIRDNGGYSNGDEGASTVAIAFSSEQVKSVANEKPTGDKDIRYSLSEDSEGRALSPAVKNRFANTKVVDEDGSLKVVYHGTAAGEFSIFDKAKGSVEGDFGSGFYFTSDEYDVSRNYEDGGPDFDNKVARRAEQIEFEEEIDYEEAERRAREELYKGGHKFEVYLNIENPAIVGETELLTQDKYLEEYDIEDYDNEDDYYGDVEQLVMDDIDGIIWDINSKVDVDKTDAIAGVLYDAYYEGGIGIAELKKRINDLYLEDSNGNLVGNEVVRQIIESLGYDGIIDNTVSDKFKNMGLSPDTTHYIVFKPNQIKAVTNQSPTDNPDIHKSLSAEGEAPKRYGNYNVRGEDVALAPVAEAVDNSVDETVDEAYPEGYEPIENAYTVEQELESVREEMKAIYEEYNALREAGKDAEAQPLFDKFLELNERGQELYNKAEAYKAEEQSYLDSLTDADAPPEVDAPYNMPRGNITLDGKTVKKVTKQVNDMLGLDAEDSAKMANTIQRYAQGEIAEDELFDEIKKNFQYGEEISNNIEELKTAKKYMRGTKIYVPAELKADFNGQRKDGYGQFRKEHLGHFVLVNDKANGLGIDQLYQELSEQFPDLFPDDIWNAADQLKQMGDVATAEPKIDYGYAPYDDGTIQEVCDIINSGIRKYLEGETLKQLDVDRQSFYESADVKEDIAPTFDTTRKEQITGQRAIFEDVQSAPTESDPAPAAEPKVAKVLESTPKKPKKVNLWEKIRNLLVDKQSKIEDVSLKTKNRELMAKADFMLRSESRAQRHIKNKLTPILEKVEATGNRNAYETYVYHLHNIDRMSLEGKAQTRLAELEEKFGHLKPEQIKAIAAKKITDKTTEKTANTIREAKEWLDLLEVKNKPVFADEVTADVSREFVKAFEAEHADARAIAEEMTQYNGELRQMLVDAGVISQETADLWAEMYPHYAPIRRAGKDGAAVTVPLDSRKTGVNAPIKRATGGNSDMESLLDVMATRTEQVYRAIARNSFGLELMHSLDTVIDTQSATVDEVLDTFDNNYEELLQEGKNGANPTFTVFEDGKRVTFEITEELYDALKPTNEALKIDVPVFNLLTKIQRGILTQYNLTFVLTNAAKDIQDVLVNSQHPVKTYANVPLATKELFNSMVRHKDGKYITEYLDNGGDDLTIFDSKKQVFKKEDGTVRKVLGFAPKMIAEANDFVEKIPRLAEYIASRKAGASIEVAMLDAARVTTNFAAGGDLTKFANRNGFTFLNASVQGAAQQVRNIREAKANGLKGVMKLAAKYAVAGLPVMLLNALFWDDDEDYEELSDYVKDNYYIVAKYGDGKFVRIPKGRAVAVIQNAFEQMKNLVTGDDEVDFERFAELAITNLAPNDPLTNNVAAPIIQAFTNKTWYGDELVPTRLQDMPAEEQYDETTDAISKWLGEVTGLSPYKINYVLDQYSGGLGDVALPYLTPESDGGGALAPFIDKFTTDSVMKNQNVSDFYDTVDELTKNANSMHATEEDILKSKYMNSVRTEISELYTMKREIQNSDLSDKEKSEQVREIQKQIDEITKNSLGSYSSIDYQSARDGKYANIGDRYFKLNDKGEWEKLDDDAVIKYKVTSAAGDAPYATDGTNHFRWYEPSEDASEDAEAGWRRVTKDELKRQNEVTKGLDISPEEYWGNKDEYCYAYDYPGKYAVSKAVGGYDAWKTYSSELYDIKADKDASGKSISGSRKEKVVEYINNLDADYYEKIILFKSEYNADDTYNYEIIEYLNNREDISYEEMEAILKELGFTVDSKGNISWD